MKHVSFVTSLVVLFLLSLQAVAQKNQPRPTGNTYNIYLGCADACPNKQTEQHSPATPTKPSLTPAEQRAAKNRAKNAQREKAAADLAAAAALRERNERQRYLEDAAVADQHKYAQAALNNSQANLNHVEVERERVRGPEQTAANAQLLFAQNDQGRTGNEKNYLGIMQTDANTRADLVHGFVDLKGKFVKGSLAIDNRNATSNRIGAFSGGALTLLSPLNAHLGATRVNESLSNVASGNGTGGSAIANAQADAQATADARAKAINDNKNYVSTVFNVPKTGTPPYKHDDDDHKPGYEKKPDNDKKKP